MAKPTTGDPAKEFTAEDLKAQEKLAKFELTLEYAQQMAMMQNWPPVIINGLQSIRVDYGFLSQQEIDDANARAKAQAEAFAAARSGQVQPTG